MTSAAAPPIQQQTTPAASQAPPQIIQIPPQQDGGLVKSLKDSIESQQRLVEKLVDQLAGLSRKMESQPQVIPVTVEIAQQPAAAGPMRPRRPRPKPKTQPAPRPEAQPKPTPKPAPEAKVAPPAKEAAPVRPQAEKKPVPPRQPQPTPPAKQEKPPAAPAGSGKARQELRDYLNSVREKLDSGTRKGPTTKDLLDYLEKLSEYLPERQKRRYRASAERLSLQMLKSRLDGHMSLREKITQGGSTQEARKAEPLTRPVLVDTFSYLKDLSVWHPDKSIGDALRNKIDSLITRVGGGA